jgi:hypothetical protein
LPLINGVIGGYKVGGAGRAIWGLLAGLTAATLGALADLGIFGAAIGAALASRSAGVLAFLWSPLVLRAD